MLKLFEKHRQVWIQEFSYSVMVGLVLFGISILINHWASTYALERVSRPVTDLILNNIPVFDVDVIILYGPFLVSLLVFGLFLWEPKRIPFVMKGVALFILIRAVFISMTHIGPFLPQVGIDSNSFFNFLGLGTTGDLFFSGHTGLPFLLSLMYWDNKYIRWVFVLISVTFAVCVLLGHLHYSIDVFAAYFITYTIFEIAKKIFAKDWRIVSR